MSPESPLHSNTNTKIYGYFFSLFKDLAVIRWGSPITLSTSEPEPDIVLACLPIDRYDNKHPEPEDIYLVIEISLSTLDYDLTTKKSIYANAEIQEYWIVDLKNRQLIIFKNPHNGDYRQKKASGK